MTIYKTAHFRVRPEAMDTARQAIRDFVAYIKAHEPDTLIYDSVQTVEDETEFLHVMAFRTAAAEEKHRSSEGVMRFVDVLYPVTVDGVQFQDYTVCASTHE